MKKFLIFFVLFLSACGAEEENSQTSCIWPFNCTGTVTAGPKPFNITPEIDGSDCLHAKRIASITISGGHVNGNPLDIPDIVSCFLLAYRATVVISEGLNKRWEEKDRDGLLLSVRWKDKRLCLTHAPKDQRSETRWEPCLENNTSLQKFQHWKVQTNSAGKRRFVTRGEFFLNVPNAVEKCLVYDSTRKVVLAPCTNNSYVWKIENFHI